MFKLEDDGRTVWFNPDSFEPVIQFQLIGSVCGGVPAVGAARRSLPP
jgi:hypothetical protein